MQTTPAIPKLGSGKGGGQSSRPSEAGRQKVALGTLFSQGLRFGETASEMVFKAWQPPAEPLVH